MESPNFQIPDSFRTRAPQPNGTVDIGLRSANADRGFESYLGKQVDAQSGTAEERARKAAEQIVSVALVQPVLKQLRESNMAAPPFAPTQGEKQFQGLMDSAISERLVHASRFPLVDRLAEQMVVKSRGTAAARAEGVQA